MLTMIAGFLLAAASGCATINQFTEPSPEERAQKVEPMLTEAGFAQHIAHSGEQMTRLKALPALQLDYYVDKYGRTHYWYADPDYCHCLFAGDQAAYSHYEKLKEQDEQLADVSAYQSQQQQDQQQMMMGPMGFFGGPGGGFSVGVGGGGFGFSF